MREVLVHEQEGISHVTFIVKRQREMNARAWLDPPSRSLSPAHEMVSTMFSVEPAPLPPRVKEIQ